MEGMETGGKMTAWARVAQFLDDMEGRSARAVCLQLQLLGHLAEPRIAATDWWLQM